MSRGVNTYSRQCRCSAWILCMEICKAHMWLMPAEPVIKLQHHPVIRQRSHSVWGVSKLRHPPVSVWSNAWLIVSVIRHESASTSQTLPLLSVSGCVTQRSCADSAAAGLIWLHLQTHSWTQRQADVLKTDEQRERLDRRQRIYCFLHKLWLTCRAKSQTWCLLQEDVSLVESHIWFD